MDPVTGSRGDRGTVLDASAAARGWSGIQLAVLAFIGFCGVITDRRPDLPRWLQTASGVLSLLALTLACVAVFLVASVGWPLASRGANDPVDPSRAPPRVRHRLRLGAALTFAAVAVMALAASANWWPVGDDGGPTGSDQDADARPLVEALDGADGRWCGRLLASDGGAVLIATDVGNIELALGGLAALSPVERC